jgi:hypothetical protein
VDLIFYGDSITWLFRGDDINGPSAVGDVDRQRSAVFQKHFGQYRTAIQAIPGARSWPPDMSACPTAHATSSPS